MSGETRLTRVLGLDEVRELLPMDTAIELQRAAFTSMAKGNTAQAPNAWLHLPGESRGWLKLLAGFDAESHGLAVKVLARFPELGAGQSLGSLLLLFDDRDGSPLAVMDAVYITAIRTAAGAALSTKALARPDSKSIGVVGTGSLAWHSLRAHRILCPNLESVRIYSRSPERREALAARAADELGYEAEATGSVAEAVRGTDVVITATNAPEPIYGAELLEEGQHIAAIGIRYELAPEAVVGCRVFSDGREEAIADGKFSTAISAGLATADDIGPELGEVLLGSAEGRQSDDQVTLFDSSGVAIQDVICARHVWERAEEEGLGVLCNLTARNVLD